MRVTHTTTAKNKRLKHIKNAIKTKRITVNILNACYFFWCECVRCACLHTMQIGNEQIFNEVQKSDDQPNQNQLSISNREPGELQWNRFRKHNNKQKSLWKKSWIMPKKTKLPFGETKDWAREWKNERKRKKHNEMWFENKNQGLNCRLTHPRTNDNGDGSTQ